MYGKQTENAIAAMSCLAEVYDGGRTRLSASEIARSRGLQGPFVAKILTTLSQAGLVKGSPGPGGGYSLATSPNEITIYEVYRLFERDDDTKTCPFGGGVCGDGDPCPLHHRLVDVQEAVDNLLHHTTFAVFQNDDEPPSEQISITIGAARNGRFAEHAGDGTDDEEKRQSYRAPKSHRGRR